MQFSLGVKATMACIRQLWLSGYLDLKAGGLSMSMWGTGHQKLATKNSFWYEATEKQLQTLEKTAPSALTLLPGGRGNQPHVLQRKQVWKMLPTLAPNPGLSLPPPVPTWGRVAATTGQSPQSPNLPRWDHKWRVLASFPPKPQNEKWQPELQRVVILW